MKTPTYHKEFFTVAVLPFRNMTNEASFEYLGFNITEEIISILTKLDAILVKAINSQFQSDPFEFVASKNLHNEDVDFIIEGSIYKINGDIKVIFYLVERRSGKYIMSEMVKLPFLELDKIPNEISSIITKRYHQIMRNLVSTSNNESIDIETNTKTGFKVKRNDVHFVKAFDNYAIIYFKRGNEYARKTLRVTMKSLEKQFNDVSMFRPHRSYLVNLNNQPKLIKSSNKYYFDFKEWNKKIPIARSKTYLLKQRLGL